MKKELQSGWNEAYDTVYHFEHFPTKAAKVETEMKEMVWVVETINWTYANQGDRVDKKTVDKKTVHKNKYFVHGLRDAIALAARIELESIEVAEEVINIGMPEEIETEEFFKVCDIQDALPKHDLAQIVHEKLSPEKN